MEASAEVADKVAEVGREKEVAVVRAKAAGRAGVGVGSPVEMEAVVGVMVD